MRKTKKIDDLLSFNTHKNYYDKLLQIYSNPEIDNVYDKLRLIITDQVIDKCGYLIYINFKKNNE